MSSSAASPRKMVETGRGTMHAWQCDHMGHVNVRAYGEKFEEACWQIYAMFGIAPSMLRAGEIKMAVVQQDIAYKRELYGGDVVVVRTAVDEVRDRVVRFVHEMVNLETGEVAATSTVTVVCLDSEAGRSRPFPAEILARARALMGEPNAGSG